MPKFRITDPSGKTYEITAPEGATREDALAFAQKQSSKQLRMPEKYNPTDGMSTFDKYAAGLGKSAVDTARGVGQFFGMVDQKDIDEAAERDKALMDTGAGMAGNITGQIAQIAIPGAQLGKIGLVGKAAKALETVRGGSLVMPAIGSAAFGATQPVLSGDSRLGNAAEAGAAGAIGQGVFNGVKTIAKKPAEVAVQKIKNLRISDAHKTGYVIPPQDANAGMGSQVLNAISGKVKTEQKASTHQPITNKLVATDLGMSPDEPITRQALANIRQKAGQLYEAAKNSGLIHTDAQFIGDIKAIGKQFEGASKDFPELANDEVGKLVQSLQKSSFNSNSAIDAIKILRDRANAAYQGGNTQLGKANKKAADAVEDMVGRHLESSGASQQIISDYREARKLIAKTYTAEKALNDSTGNISGRKLANELSKERPLEGGMKKAATFAQSFPKAAQELQGVNPYSILDGFAGLGGLVANPAITAGVASRPLIRSLLLSPQYQKTFVKGSEGSKLAELLKDSKVAKTTKYLPTALVNLLRQESP